MPERVEDELRLEPGAARYTNAAREARGFWIVGRSRACAGSSCYELCEDAKRPSDARKPTERGLARVCRAARFANEVSNSRRQGNQYQTLAKNVHTEVCDANGVRSFFEANVHPNVLKPLDEAKGKRYVVLIDEGEIVAAATLQRRPFGFEQIGGVLVASAQRCRGLSHLMLPAVMAEAKAAGSKWLVGGVYRRAPDVSPIYRSLGFKTWIPYIPGASSRWPLGVLARFLAWLIRTPAGPHPIRLMGGRVR